MEEEMHKQEERKKAIEFAKQYQFYQTERVKKLHVLLRFSYIFIYLIYVHINNLTIFLKYCNFLFSQDFFLAES